MNKKTEQLIHAMVANIVLQLLDKFKEEDCFEVLNNFSQSETFEKLWNEKTELWKESPEYIIDEYLKEINLY